MMGIQILSYHMGQVCTYATKIAAKSTCWELEEKLARNIERSFPLRL